jgi:hypothetical protein
MPTIQVTAQLTVDQLIEAVRQLTPAERQRFEREWTAFVKQSEVEEEQRLRAAANYRLSRAKQARLDELHYKADMDTLTEDERREWLEMVDFIIDKSTEKAEAMLQLQQREKQTRKNSGSRKGQR